MTLRIAGVALALCSLAAGAVRKDMLVSTEWLANHLNDPGVVVLQVSRERAAYDQGHIPGARFLALTEIAVSVNGVSNELPPVADLKRIFEGVGVSDGSRVVLYADDSVLPATRAYFTLDYLGHGDKTSLLDGGIQKWRAENRPVTKDAPAVTAGKFNPTPQPQLVVSTEQVKSISQAATSGQASRATLVDARPPEEFASTKPGTGNIPGAVSMYWMQGQTSKEDTSLKPEAELQRIYQGAGIAPGGEAITYCNSGMQATQSYFTLRYLGYDARLYDGSFSEWMKAQPK